MHSRTVQSKTTQALRQVSTLPHRESDGIFLLCFSGIYLFCGVGILRRYDNMIARNRLRRNWRISQFLTAFFGQRDKGEGPAERRALRSVSNNPLPPPFMGGGGRVVWGKARSRWGGGAPGRFYGKRAFSNICKANIRTPPALRAPPS